MKYLSGQKQSPGSVLKKGLRLATLVKKESPTLVFPVNFAKFLRTAFSYNTSCGCSCRVENSDTAGNKIMYVCYLLVVLKVYLILVAYNMQSVHNRAIVSVFISPNQ